MPRLLLATNNAGKVRELRALLEPDGWTVLTPSEAGIRLEPEETGATYAENAAIKAHAFAQAAGVPALADDSGLEVDALGGRPGVHSARYGGAGLSAEDKVEMLLRELAGVPQADRGARFRAVIVVAAPDGRAWQSEGVCEGRIAPAPRGANGFGYDPVFLLPERGLTMAELGEEEKNRISHRALAVRAAIALLEGLREEPAFCQETS